MDPIRNIEQAQVLPYNVVVTHSGRVELIPKVASDVKTIYSQLGIEGQTYGCLSFMEYSGRVSLENCAEDQIWNWNPDSKIAIWPTGNSGPNSMEVVVQGYLIDEFLDGEGKDVTGKATILRKDESLLLYVR